MATCRALTLVFATLKLTPAASDEWPRDLLVMWLLHTLSAVQVLSLLKEDICRKSYS